MEKSRLSVSWVMFDGVPEISVAGEIDIATAAELDEVFFEARMAEPFSLIVSLEGCGYCDSSGLSVLLRHAHHVPNFISVVPEDSDVRRLFRVAKVEETLGVVGSMIEARVVTHIPAQA